MRVPVEDCVEEAGFCEAEDEGLEAGLDEVVVDDDGFDLEIVVDLEVVGVFDEVTDELLFELLTVEVDLLLLAVDAVVVDVVGEFVEDEFSDDVVVEELFWEELSVKELDVSLLSELSLNEEESEATCSF